MGQESVFISHYPEFVEESRKEYMKDLNDYFQSERKRLETMYEKGEIDTDELLDLVLQDNLCKKEFINRIKA